MSTLQAELLRDFEDSGSEGGDNADDGLLGDAEEDALMGINGDVDMADGAGDLMSSDDEAEDEAKDHAMGGTDYNETLDETKARVDKMKLGGISDIASVALLMKTLEPLLQKIHFYEESPASTLGNAEDNPEWHILKEANSLSLAIDGEVYLVTKWLKDHFSVRFPELESLVTNHLDYAKSVAILGNVPFDSETIKKMPQSKDNALGIALESVLDRPTLMVVTTSCISSTSKGQLLPQDELDRIVSACKLVIRLDEAKKTLTAYVQSRMNTFAPNLTAIVGSLTAAQLLNTAGGLSALSKTPSCNIGAWGAKRGANAGGLSTNVGGIRQQGYIFQSPIFREISRDVHKQAMRAVTGKLILAARIDRAGASPDGSAGEEMREQCLERLEKLQEKPLNKNARALPIPDDKPARKRGGRRARKAKEATAMTDLRKAQNRMAFNKEEKEVGYGAGDSTKGLGMIGVGSDNKIRSLQVDQRTRAKLSAKSKGWGGVSSVSGGAASSLRGFGQAAGNLALGGKGLRTSGVGTTVGSSGTVSSLSFTPVQGLELVDPRVRADLTRKRKAEEDRYFKGGTFTQLGGDGGFRKPDLPPAKKVNTGKSA